MNLVLSFGKEKVLPLYISVWFSSIGSGSAPFAEICRSREHPSFRYGTDKLQSTGSSPSTFYSLQSFEQNVRGRQIYWTCDPYLQWDRNKLCPNSRLSRRSFKGPGGLRRRDSGKTFREILWKAGITIIHFIKKINYTLSSIKPNQKHYKNKTYDYEVFSTSTPTHVRNIKTKFLHHFLTSIACPNFEKRCNHGQISLFARYLPNGLTFQMFAKIRCWARRLL